MLLRLHVFYIVLWRLRRLLYFAYRHRWCVWILLISVYLMLETSNIPIYARCRNIKYTDICKMQKHQIYRYMQDAAVYLMFLHLAYIGIFDVSASCIYRYFWCFCILHISVYLMFLHLAHIGIFYVSASCIYRYIWCF
jgi:hypothetical protein